MTVCLVPRTLNTVPPLCTPPAAVAPYMVPDNIRGSVAELVPTTVSISKNDILHLPWLLGISLNKALFLKVVDPYKLPFESNLTSETGSPAVNPKEYRIVSVQFPENDGLSSYTVPKSFLPP